MAQKLWTDEEVKYLAVLYERNLSHRIIAQKLNRTENAIRRKLSSEGLSSYKYYKVGDTIITFEQMRRAEENDISAETVKSRVSRGMTVERAITEPIAEKHRRRSDVDEISKGELIRILGRMKYLNMTESKAHPLHPTEPMLKQAKEYGLSLESIKPVEVGEA